MLHGVNCDMGGEQVSYMVSKRTCLLKDERYMGSIGTSNKRRHVIKGQKGLSVKIRHVLRCQ